MYSESAAYYDLLYKQFKDYAAEAEALAAVLRSEMPSAECVLDVACGTGEHALHLSRDHGFQVDGIDVEQRFVEIASRKNPGGHFVCADMAGFDLGRMYDAVVCLFSSIGYVKTRERLLKALRCFGRHLNSNGVILVEPSFLPGQLKSNHLTMQTAEADHLQVCRMGRTRVHDGLVELDFEYLVADAAGTRHFKERHELALFSVDDMHAAFQEAGLESSFDEAGLNDRGVYIARCETTI